MYKFVQIVLGGKVLGKEDGYHMRSTFQEIKKLKATEILNTLLVKSL